jgi:tRNA dimethylallyltransferase
MMSRDHTLIVIAGPTAVGKTAVAVELARRLGTEIISADSRQCYREMSIGTAKPSPEELEMVPHHFIDTFPVTEALTAADYERLGLRYAAEIFTRHKTAIVCGGTGLYIRALCEGLDEMPEVDPEISAFVRNAYRDHGLSWLQEAVQAEDPLFYEQSAVDNPARLVRALVFIRSTGQSILQFRKAVIKDRPFRVAKAGLELPRELLYERINRRVDEMMDQGLLEEAIGLYPLRHLKNLQTVGYSELFDYLDGSYSLGHAVEQIKQHTRNYAKRQMTWFRKEPGIQWFRADEPEVVAEIRKLLVP